MKDLIITYTSENKVIKKEYDHIFDFTDEIEDTNISVPTQRNITATFFENRTEKFNTMDDLYRHCVAIFKIISNTKENMSMRKEIITAIDRDGIEVRIHSLVFNIYKEKINLIDTIKGAVASYINSGYGFREYENNCYNFNWGDLLLIPNSFLRQFGIERESETESTEVDFNEQLFSANDLNFTEEKWETLKRKLFMQGRKALEDYLDTDTENLDKDSIENLLDQVSEQMPDEESFRYYSKYCLDADNSVEIKEDLISTNMGDIPKRDYLDIKAQQYGFDDYADMRSQGLVLNI